MLTIITNRYYSNTQKGISIVTNEGINCKNQKELLSEIQLIREEIESVESSFKCYSPFVCIYMPDKDHRFVNVDVNIIQVYAAVGSARRKIVDSHMPRILSQ